ncbi:lipoprotein [Microbacterium mangrovi]|uniref:Lipoprotein n=1 Tax=Microbacterium mangrovi TaxID=1348253 RepID=A0A0B2A3M8_9MICO|nr:iron uptake system protein EfeO [Microbacterium mangrovi]KHK96187.1 lipoprotein [Microbacterium mangrovi]
MTRSRTAAALAGLAVAAVALSGCVAKADAAGRSQNLSVTSTDQECTVSGASATSGTIDFAVKNTGSQTTEFYLLAHDGLRIVGEVENIAPGASRTLTVTAQPGSYYTVCKPGMVGDGVGRTAFEVTGGKVEAAGSDAARQKAAVDQYASFVKNQVEQLVPAVAAFTAAYAAGDDAKARDLFAKTRIPYERIEPIAESLGDLDPKIDYREVDADAEGLPWTGFHRIEKDLWVPAKSALNSDAQTPAWQDWKPSTTAERQKYAAGLAANVKTLNDYVHSAKFTAALEAAGVAGLSNGAISLLDEVAKNKITGEEDWWSHTDLWDFAANVDGSKMAFSLVEDLAASKGSEGKALVARIDKAYRALEAKLATYGNASSGYVSYTKLTTDDKRQLTDLLNALAEPLSQLTSTVAA